MNVARVAALLRELADELEADEGEAERVSPPPAPKSRPRARRVPPMPENVADIDRAFAARILAQKGGRRIGP